MSEVGAEQQKKVRRPLKPLDSWGVDSGAWLKGTSDSDLSCFGCTVSPIFFCAGLQSRKNRPRHEPHYR